MVKSCTRMDSKSSFNNINRRPKNIPACSDDVFVGDRKKVPLLVGQLDAGLGHRLHGGGHVVVTLSLKKLNRYIEESFFFVARNSQTIGITITLLESSSRHLLQVFKYRLGLIQVSITHFINKHNQSKR
jgi:hypothetical protein